MTMRLIEISDEYIEYMKKFFENILDNKMNSRKHGRKYLGVIMNINNQDYFAPLSSPKKSDYNTDGSIKNSTIIVLRMITKKNSKEHLLGTIKLNNMIPVPSTEIINYNLNLEKDKKYKNLVINELRWIQKNTSKITKAAQNVYNIKMNENKNINSKNERFLNSIISFKEAEEKCKLFKK